MIDGSSGPFFPNIRTFHIVDDKLHLPQYKYPSSLIPLQLSIQYLQFHQILALVFAALPVHMRKLTWSFLSAASTSPTIFDASYTSLS